MAGLRGSNINASDFADNDVVMQLISVSDGDGETLPLDYDPQMIGEYWGRRPVSVLTRIAQLIGVVLCRYMGSSFLCRFFGMLDLSRFISLCKFIMSGLDGCLALI